MTEQETREKIFNIIREFNVKKRRYSTHTEPSDDDELANALIAAGIGDVKEVEAEANRYEMLYKMQSRDMVLAERKVHEAEHRAEVAERALRKAVSVLDAEYRAFGVNRENKTEQRIKNFIEQAEKELAEEGKE